MKRTLKTVLIGFSAIGFFASFSANTAQAQDVANGTATATVQTALAVTAAASLVFGTVFQGVAKTLDEANANAGVFTITGQSLSGLSWFLALPEFMATASGDDRMSIAFSGTDAAIDTTANANPTTIGLGAFVNQNPYSLPAAPVGGTGVAALFFGGTITPSVNQTAGAYTADITLTVAYDGT
ncbi:MAG: hypothetical protein IIB00_09795 [candidate division Zixibacteria bacterium]|nr:hypothetical protein [candidate division Zixibacteria bacterium]